MRVSVTVARHTFPQAGEAEETISANRAIRIAEHISAHFLCMYMCIYVCVYIRVYIIHGCNARMQTRKGHEQLIF